MSQSRILLVDDHPVVHEGLAQYISREQGLSVCAVAETASDALQLVGVHNPDLVVTDLSLTGKLGLELIKDLAAQHAQVPILVLSIHDEMLWAERVLRAGAEGYVMKSQPMKQIVEAIRRVLGGGLWISNRVNEIMLQKQFQHRKPLKDSPLEQLSDRELEVFMCIGRGMNVKEIASSFHLSSKTVEVHRDHVREKLRLKSSAELIRYAVSYLLAET